MIDFNVDTSAPLLVNDGDLVLQQLDMLFDTRKGEVLGEYKYGSDFDRFLWNLQISNDRISNYVNSLIGSTIDTFGFNITVDTTILYGTVEDIILIKVNIKKPGYNLERVYKI